MAIGRGLRTIQLCDDHDPLVHPGQERCDGSTPMVPAGETVVADILRSTDSSGRREDFADRVRRCAARVQSVACQG